MNDHQAQLLKLFTALLETQRTDQDSLNASGMSIIEDQCHFSIPNLFHFAQSFDDQFKTLSYSQFRSTLFKTPINEHLSTLNAQIVIIQNRHKVDLSTYGLVRINENQES